MSKDKKHIYVDSFLQNLRIVIKEALAIVPEDPRIYRINKRIMLAIQMEPGLTINKVGELLYKYKDFIYDASTEDLMFQWDFSKEIITDSKETEDVALMVMFELKRALQSMSLDQRKYYRAMIISLLDDYLEYKCA